MLTVSYISFVVGLLLIFVLLESYANDLDHIKRYIKLSKEDDAVKSFVGKAAYNKTQLVDLLCLAARHLNTKIVSWLVLRNKHKTIVDGTCDKNFTSLQQVCKYYANHTNYRTQKTKTRDVIQTLILKGAADPNELSHEGYTCLHYAGAKGSIGMLRTLLDCGADPNKTTAGNFTVFDIILGRKFFRARKIEAISMLLEENARPVTHNHSLSLLRYAIHNMEKSVVDSLLNPAAVANCKDCLHEAVRKGYCDVAEFLINHGISVEAIHTRSGFTALHVAVYAFSKKCVKLLLRNGGNRTAVVSCNSIINNSRGFLPLHLAVTKKTAVPYSSYAICMMLLSNCTDEELHQQLYQNVSCPSNLHYGQNTMELAARNVYQNKNVTSLLKKVRDELAAKNSSMAALSTKGETTTEGTSLSVSSIFLMSSRTSPKIWAYSSPITFDNGHMYSTSNYTMFLNRSLADGMNPDIVLVNASRQTALHVVSGVGNLAAVTLLLEYNASRFSIDTNRSTPVHYAAHNGHRNVTIELVTDIEPEDQVILLEHKNKFALTPVKEANLSGYTELAEMLEETHSILSKNETGMDEVYMLVIEIVATLVGHLGILGITAWLYRKCVRMRQLHHELADRLDESKEKNSEPQEGVTVPPTLTDAQLTVNTHINIELEGSVDNMEPTAALKE